MIKQRQILTSFSLLLIFTLVLLSFDCYSQDSTSKTKILVLERIYKNVTYKHPAQRKIRIGNRISVKINSNDSIIKGKIESLTDSSIILNEKMIFLNDINKLNTNTGNTLIISGLSLTVSSIYFFLFSFFTNYFDYDIEELERFSLYGCFYGGFIAISGISYTGYKIDKNWKIFVTTIEKKK